MSIRLLPLLASLGLAAIAAAQAAMADTLLMQRTEKEAAMSLPSRGMSMSQVESRFGAPRNKLDPRGGNTRPLRVKEKEKEKEEEKPTQIEGTFIEYRVKDGDIFSVVLQNFNVALKDEGRPTITTSDVKKVNPKVDLNRIRVGQIILLPVPDKKR